MASPTRSSSGSCSGGSPRCDDAPDTAGGRATPVGPEVPRIPISAIVVHYRTPALLEAAVDALHRDARASGFEMHVVVVDNGACSEGPAEYPQRLDPKRVPATIIEPTSNLGYAGGLNRGARGQVGDVLLMMNADVVVEPGCLQALVHALADAEIAGPRLFWDRGCRLMLPPQQIRTRAAELDAAWAERSVIWGRSYRQRWRRRARAFWSAREPAPCFELTGALLAVRRDFWERVGPFDESYRLYFEETDWLLRAQALGGRAVLAPAARAFHAYDQSARRAPRAQMWFEESMARFRRRRYGTWFAALLWLLEQAPRRFADPAPLPDGRLQVRSDGETWIEVTPLPLGVPAAGCRLDDGAGPADFELPEDVVEGARAELWVQASDGACRDLGGKRRACRRSGPH